jgi:hypothetical protein
VGPPGHPPFRSMQQQHPWKGSAFPWAIGRPPSGQGGRRITGVGVGGLPGLS